MKDYSGMENFKCAYTDKIKLTELKESPLNANMHPPEQITRLAEIIEFNGQRAPIVVSKRSGFIVKGHARLMALRQIGWEYAAVDFQDYEDEAREYADLVADNEIARWAEFDIEKHRFNLEEKHFDIEQKYYGIEKYDPIIEQEIGANIEGDEDFATELGEKTDYLVLTFSNRDNFLKACDKFGAEREKFNISGSGNPMYDRMGLGRVIKGDGHID